MNQELEHNLSVKHMLIIWIRERISYNGSNDKTKHTLYVNCKSLLINI